MTACSLPLVAVLICLLGSISGLSVFDVMVNNGSRGDGYFDPKNIADFGVLKDVSSNTAAMKKFQKLSQIHGHGGSDGETVDLIKKFFWGKSNGIIMEIGAMDGVQLSQSQPLEALAGWHRILVEGSPKLAQGLKNNTPSAFAFTCAICDTTRHVHYISNGNSVGGIIEFMSPYFLSRFHKEIQGTEPAQWANLPNVQKVACFPLQKLLAVTHVYHINAFIVDVEGGELAMLHSIDWSAVLFDIIVVETDTVFRAPGYEFQVTAFLSHKGYHPVYHKGRNTWYKHITFKPSVMPRLSFW